MVLIPRRLLPLGQDLLDHFPITVIQGARQVGKSTLAQQLCARRVSRYVTLDDDATLAAVDLDPAGFVAQLSSGTLIVDEIQRRPDLLRTIKSVVDRDRTPGRFLLTGSADLLRLTGETDSLAGRAVSLRLRGLSMGEAAGGFDDAVTAVASGADPGDFRTAITRSEYVRALLEGGYPEVRQLPERLRGHWLSSYLERVLERDALALPSGGQRARIRTIARLLAANQAGELIKARLADAAEVPQTSITAYLDALEGTYLIDLLPPWIPNLTSREIGRNKVVVSDSALAATLMAVETPALEQIGAAPLGRLFEGFVVSELLKQRGWSQTPHEVFHYRQRTGREVDVILQLSDERVIAIEIKASTTYKADQFRHLAQLRDQLGDRFIAGVVVGMAPTGARMADRLWGLPASALWELSA